MIDQEIIADDPFTQVYLALWSLLERHAGFHNLVKVGNRIFFAGRNRAELKDELSTADLPEVRLVPTGGSVNIGRTSGSSSWTKRFEIHLITGDMRLDYSLFPLEWEITRAMSGWQEIVKGLLWKDKQYVKIVRHAEIVEGAGIIAGKRGWAAVWACEVEMWFETKDLESEEIP